MTLVPYYWEGAFALLCALILLTWCIAEWWKYFRARRAERQLENEMRMRAGMREAQRCGWLEDLH